jgi:hypothetical protein
LAVHRFAQRLPGVREKAWPVLTNS